MERFVALRKCSRDPYLLPAETLDEALSKLQGYADCLEIHGRTLESLIHDYRRDGSIDGLEELAERMVENAVWFATLLGAIRKFERLIKTHGFETRVQQEMALTRQPFSRP